MICKYCQAIHSYDGGYPLREATRDVKTDYPRCDWHWRFVCSICGRPRHFNGIAWCEETKRFTCLSCAKSHRFVRCTFWRWKGYYSVKCDACSEHHPVLDYLEFLRKHPWQLHPEMQERLEGLDDVIGLQATTSEYVPLKKGVVSEKQISQAWDKFAHKWSDRYTEYGDMNRQYIIDPVIFRLLGSVKDLSILDAGCGNGYLCRLLARKGAKMVGVDISKRFIQIIQA